MPLIMHRHTPHTVTKERPAELLMGRQVGDELPSTIEFDYASDTELVDNDQLGKLKQRQSGNKRKQVGVSDIEIGNEG